MVRDSTEVTISKAEAVHQINVAPVDIDGNPLAVNIGGELVEHKASGVEQWFIFFFPTQRWFSDISDAYSWEWATTDSLRSKDRVYDFNGFANDGITGDLLFQNQPSDLKHMSFRYTTPPDAENILVRHWLSGGPTGGLSFTAYNSGLANSLTEPFTRDEYFMPNPYPDFPFGFFFEDVFPIDIATGDVLWDSQVSRTLYLAAKDSSTVEGFTLGDSLVPLFSTNSDQMPVALAPPHWFGGFDNTGTVIRVGAARGRSGWLFLNQMQDMTPHPGLTYELYKEGQLVETGDLEKIGDPLSSASTVSIPASPGPYTMKTSYDKYYVSGDKGLATLSATFDTGAADKNPPTLLRLNVLAGVQPDDSIPPTASAQIRVTFDEVLPVPPGISYSTGDGTTWQALAVTDLGSGDYSAVLPTLPNNSIVSLRVQAQDAAGNSMDYRIVPALVVTLDAPILLSPPKGHATDDRQIAFHWDPVPTAAEYLLQVHTADSFGSASLAEATVAATQYTAGLDRGVYYWRVLASDNQGNRGPWSAARQLTIADPVVQVTTDTRHDIRPAISGVIDGSLWVAWESCRPQCRVWYKTGDAGGTAWSGDTQLTLQNYSDYDPAIAQTTGDRVGVVWYSWRNTNPSGVWNYDIFFKATDDYGATWSVDTHLTTHTGQDYSPSIAQTKGGNTWVVWHSDRSGNSDLWFSTSDGVDGAWSDAVQLTTDTAPDQYPSITQTSDGKIWVVWNRFGSIYYKTSDDDGATWTEDARLTSCCNNRPSIAQTTDGRIWMAWYGWSTVNPAGVGNWDIWYKASDDNGATWSPESLFTRFVGTDVDPDIAALASGDLGLVWSSDRALNNDIFYGVVGDLEDVNPPPVLRSATHLPYPNPDSEDVVTVTSVAVDETGIASVQLVWSVDGVSTGDLTMLDDGQHNDGPPGDGTYGVAIGPFPVGVRVSYQIRVTDIDSNTVLAPRFPNSFLTLEPLVPTSSILLVFDSISATGLDSYFKVALSNLGVPFDFWDSTLRGYVDLPTLNLYLNGLVVWSMPFFGFLSNIGAQENLASYLDGGGKLFISGQDIGYYIGRSSFYRQYLHAIYIQDNVNFHGLKGVTGDPITDGLALTIDGGTGASNQFYPSEIDAIAPAVSILTYDDTVPAAAPNPQFAYPQQMMDTIAPSEPTAYPDERDGSAPAPLSPEDLPLAAMVSDRPGPHHDFSGQSASTSLPNGGAEAAAVVSSGTGAVRVESDGYRVVYFAFGFEAISSATVRHEVMQRVINWLDPSIFAIGTVRGVVDLQWRSDNSGARVALAGTNFSAITGSDGSFVLSAVPQGEYEIRVTCTTYLPALKSAIVVTTGQVTELPPVRLRGGDMNLDGRVDLRDLTDLAQNFNMTESRW